ncbi:MAG TPA: PDZ domain-containing protein [Pyrinomonadaceae bacterium]
MKCSVINRGARARPWGAACLCALALLFVLPATGHAQHQQGRGEVAQTPPAKAAPRAVESEQRPEAKGVPAQAPAPVVVPGAPVRMPGAVLPAAPAPPTAQTPRAAAVPQAAPRNVVTVVHRLNGWQMLSLMAAKGGERWVIDELPPAAEFHTNIVAGFVSEDGRTVMARLPTAEAELFAAAASMFPALPGAPAPPPDRLEGAPGFTVIRSDGKRVGARFVGLDASTGLSLLEAAEQLLVSAPHAPVVAPAVGQRVRLFAPAPALAPFAPAAPPVSAAPPHPAGDSGHTETIYFSIGETKGQLTEVRRASTGKPVQATVRSKLLTPEWAGAIATSEEGDFVGIVGDSGHTESAIVPAEAIRLARERVLARRASVPRPWLGVSGDAVSRFSLEQMLARGWPRDFALPLLNRPQGVLLTQITPGAPAALAGLRPGDIISRVGQREVSGVDDFSMLLREAGAGARLDLTVLRALERAPLNLTVELSGTLLPGVRPDDVQNPLVGHGAETVGLSPRGAAPLRARGGLLVVSVHAGTNAARAGLRPGDIVETINGLPVTRAGVRPLPGVPPSDMTLGVVRDGRRLDLRLAHAEPPPEKP